MKNFAFICSTVAKLSKCCVLKVNSTKVTFLVVDDNVTHKQITVWCEIPVMNVFSEYNAEGQGPTNEIYMELPSDMLSSSISLLKQNNSNARSVKIKLTDKHSPCLTVEMDLSNDLGSGRQCIHDIPTKLIPRASWPDYAVPSDMNFQVAIDLPNLKKMRTVIDRMKKLSPCVTMSANREGMMAVVAEVPIVTVRTIFKNLNTPLVNLEEGVSEVTVRVESKRLHQLMCCEQLSPRKGTCHFLENECVKFHLWGDQFSFQFILVCVEE